MDRSFMERCLELAREAAVAGDHPFGAVIVSPDGGVAGEGRNRVATGLDVTAHAEIDALRNAMAGLGTTDLSGHTLYASGEPCLMCSVAVRAAHISRVVYGASSARESRVSPHPLTDPGFGEGPPPVVEGGLMEEESLRVQGRL